MYASLEIFVGVPGIYDDAAKVAANAPERYKGKKGFKTAVFFSDKARNEYGLLTIWDHKADVEAFRKSFPPPKGSKSSLAGTLFEQRTFYVNNFFSADKPASKK